jgi:hypothetical protein
MSMERSTFLIDERIHQRSAGVAVDMHRSDPWPADVKLDEAPLDEVLGQMEIASGQGSTRAEEGRPPIHRKGQELLLPSIHDGS